jgi:hypothetical protein
MATLLVSSPAFDQVPPAQHCVARPDVLITAMACAVCIVEKIRP